MDSETAVNLCQQTLYTAILIGTPILLAGLLTGLVVGLFQAVTQIQEQTLPVILKIIVMMLVGAWFLPWMCMKLLEFGRELLQNIPETLSTLM
ncbi:MAG: flagellar biosynthetic protein FliQ [Planctomycetia bacterium]|nr:flagellar biosynthetic protein FliQ [Planctomycetia bacterium]